MITRKAKHQLSTLIVRKLCVLMYLLLDLHLVSEMRYVFNDLVHTHNYHITLYWYAIVEWLCTIDVFVYCT